MLFMCFLPNIEELSLDPQDSHKKSSAVACDWITVLCTKTKWSLEHHIKQPL